MFALLTMGGGAFVIILGGELVLRMFFPEEILFPRMEHSEAYGFWNPKSTQMVHARPGRWRFVYTTNRYRSRGPVTPVSNHYEKINVVTIGDSFTFGTGVDDGEEYPAIMHGQLENRFNVINIAVGGFGLAQQIRRYYEFGQLYHPKIVVSQFCINDPGDNFRNRVTRIEDGRFVFEDVGYPGRFQLWLSRSYLLQHSQTYSFLQQPLLPGSESASLHERRRGRGTVRPGKPIDDRSRVVSQRTLGPVRARPPREGRQDAHDCRR